MPFLRVTKTAACIGIATLVFVAGCAKPFEAGSFGSNGGSSSAAGNGGSAAASFASKPPLVVKDPSTAPTPVPALPAASNLAGAGAQ